MRKSKRRWLWGIPAVALAGLWHLIMVEAGAVGSGDGWLVGWYWGLLALSLAGAALTGVLLFEERGGRNLRLEQVYPWAGLLLGILYLVVLPPLSAPDEVSHYISAYQLSSRMLGQPSNSEDGRVLVRARDWFAEDVYGDYVVQETEPYLVKQAAEEDGRDGVVLGQVLEEKTYRAIHEGDYGGKPEEPEKMALSAYPPVVTTPLAYVPQALGISLARLLNLNSMWLLWLGRLCNLLFFVGMTQLAMRRLPFGKEVLFGAALLPMTLNLASSFSYDVMILACMFLFTSECLYLAYGKDRVQIRDVLLLALLMAVAGPCKMVYGAMMGLCLLIPVKKFGGWGQWFLSAAAVAGAWAAAMLLVNGRVVVNYATAAEGVTYGMEEAGFSLTTILHRPMLTAQMFYNTLVHQTEEYHMTMIGSRLGNLDPVLNVPYPAVLAMSLGLLLLALRKPGEQIFITGAARVWIVFVCAVCGAALMLSMLIAWTPQTSTVIQGVQGRYFLPFLPALLMACKNDWLVLTKDKDRSILYVMYCVNLYVVLRLFSVVCARL